MERQGVGARVERYVWDEKWWEGHYANAAEKFSCVMDSKDGNKVKNKSKAKGRRENGKSSEDWDEASERGAETEAEAELRLMEELSKGNHRGSTFGGRAGKLERVAKFQAEELAKYGIQSGAAATAAATAEASKKKKERMRDAPAVAEASSRGTRDDVPSGTSYEGERSKTTNERDWWSKAGFAWGGVVGSKRERDLDSRDASSAKPRGFTEDDQESLFKSAHEFGVTRGTHRGLGGKGAIKSEWTGERKSFADDAEPRVDEASREKKLKKDKKDKKVKKDKKSAKAAKREKSRSRAKSKKKLRETAVAS